MHEPEHRRDLRDPLRGQLRLVVEDPAEVLTVGEDRVLQRQERAARIDQVEARQVVVQRDFLRAQVLLDRHRVVGAALDGRVVGDDHALAAADPAHPGDDARGGRVTVVEPVRRERRKLKERRAGIEQRAHAVAGEQLAAGGMPLAGSLGPAPAGLGQLAPELGHQGGVGRAVAGERRTGGIHPAP